MQAPTTDIKVSVYDGAKDTSGVVVPIETVFDRISSGANGLKEKTKLLNVLVQTEPDVYKKEKAKLPAVTFSGTFPKGKRKAQYLRTHSGYITIDIDGLSPEQTAQLLAELAQMPHIVLAFVSPSGLGIKVVVRVNPIPTNDLEHKGAYQACLDFFEDLAEEYGFTIDTSGKDCNRLCYLAHDPLAIFHEGAPAIDWDKDAWITEQAEREQRLESASANFEGEADLAALDSIQNDCDYETWRNIGMAIKHAGFGVDVFQKWTGGRRKRSTGEWVDADILAHWGRFQRTTGRIATWGTVVFLAKENGYKPPTNAKRYRVDKDFVHTTSDMETERDGNAKAIRDWIEKVFDSEKKECLVLGSAAGTGKTTIGTTTIECLLYIAKTTEEADNVYEMLKAREDDVYRHRPRMHNRGHKDFNNQPDWETLPLGLDDASRPCDCPETCNLLAARDHTALLFCILKCPSYVECQERAFLSQADKEKNTSKVVYAWNEVIVCDSTYKGLVKRICGNEDVLIADEVNPLALTQSRVIDRDRLFDLAERFRHPHNQTVGIYKTLKRLLDLLSTSETPEAFINGLSDWIDGIEDITAMDEKLSKYPVGVVMENTPETATHEQPFQAVLTYQNQEVSVPVVDFQTGDDTPAFFVPTDTPIETDTYQMRFVPFEFLLKFGLADFDDPPRKYHTLLRDIKTFFAENRNRETAPFTFSPKQQTFEFHLKPTLNHRRVIFNTASDPDNLIGEAYRETDINITRHTGTPPAWKTVLVFQIPSGNYLPRHSLVKYSTDGKPHLKARAQELIDAYIRPSITAGLKTLVVAPKAFQKVESVNEWAVTELDDWRAGYAMLINHHHAEGRNDYQDFDIVFVFHYEPNHSEIQAAAKRLYRNPETPLDFTREKRAVTVGGVSFEKNVYTDARVQAVYNRETGQRLMQSDLRLRPNIHENKIIVNLTAEPIDIPVTPIPFSLSDKQHFTGDWVAFKAALHTKTEAVQTAEVNGDVKALAEQTGQSQRTARRQTNQARQQLEAERDAEIVRLHSEGHSQREIERHLKQAGYTKASRKVISRVLKSGAKRTFVI